MAAWRALGAAVLCVAGVAESWGKLVDIEAAGAVANDDAWDTIWKNGAVLNSTLGGLQPGDVWVVPNKTFYVMGGIVASNLNSVTLQFDGTIAFAGESIDFERYIKSWPRKGNKDVLECILLEKATNLTVTSSGVGTLNGYGQKWWGIPGIGYLARQENRPRLFNCDTCSDVLVENMIFLQSPYWTFLASSVNGLEVRHSIIDARRLHDDGHNIIDTTAFNTDGFDVSGTNVWVHDCSVWNQDDSFCVKDGSSDMVFERIRASGIGLTIGSIGDSTVRNITFRDAYMHKSVKGIYLKFRGGAGLIADVTYENIVMDAPEQWPIWIGPAQQSDSVDLCAAHPCSICWPGLKSAVCPGVPGARYVNITLRNITVNNPKMSPGVLIADSSSPMQNIVFDDVKVVSPGSSPWGNDYYKCENVQGVATGGTWPVPPCMKDRTDAAVAIET